MLYYSKSRKKSNEVYKLPKVLNADHLSGHQHFKFTFLFRGLLSKIINIHILEGPQFFFPRPFQASERHPLERGEGGRESDTKFSIKTPGTLLVMFKDSEL